MFDRIDAPPADALHGVMAKFREDPRPNKMDLGVGVYRDDTGRSPVMRAVKAAETELVETEDSKAYQALHGDDRFVEAMTELVFGASHPAVRDDRIAAIQGTGGTGSLRIGFDLARNAHPGAKVHVGVPTWPNHLSLVEAAGLELVAHRYFDIERQSIDIAAIEEAAARAGKGDLFLFHGPCHNPTGADLSAEQRASLLATLTRNGAVPLMDVAYYGMGDRLQQDLELVRTLAASAERALIAVACSKSFGLYRERTGILFVVGESAAEKARIHGEIARISRTLVSMPPAHGAGTVARILSNPLLRADWEKELEEMRQRMLGLRAELAAFSNQVPMLRGVEHQKGIFRMLPLTPEQTERLGQDHAIHMAPSGRINIAGLKAGDASRLAEALRNLRS